MTGDGKVTAIRPLVSVVAGPQPARLPKGHQMKTLGIAAATAIAFAPLSVVATTPEVAQAAPCAGLFANPTSCQNCLLFVEVYHTSNVCDKAASARPAQPPTSVVPVQIPELPPELIPPQSVLPEPSMPEHALPEPPPPSVTPVQTRKVVPPSRPSSSAMPAATHEPAQPAQPWWPVALGYGLFAAAVALVAYRLRI